MARRLPNRLPRKEPPLPTLPPPGPPLLPLLERVPPWGGATPVAL